MEQDKEKETEPIISYGDQDENGIDLSLLRENLRRTPTERLIRAEQAAASLFELKRNAVKRNHRRGEYDQELAPTPAEERNIDRSANPDHKDVGLIRIRKSSNLTEDESLEWDLKFDAFADEIRRAGRASGLRKDG